MPKPERFDRPGNSSNKTDFRNQKATELANLLQEEVLPFACFVDARKSESHDIVVLDIEPEVSQHPQHDIRNVERIAVLFDPEDKRTPEPRALRKNFPWAPHQNIRPEGEARSLCLYEEPYEERRLSWTAAKFIRRLQEWLTKTARGDLHDENQPLEQLFLGTLNRIILPSSLYSTETPDHPAQLTIVPAENANRLTLIAFEDTSKRDEEDPQFVGLTYDATPRTHGLIQFQPQSIAELSAFLEQEGENFLEELRSRVKQWQSGEDRPLESQLIVILRVPKRRKDDSPVEAVEVWAFATKKSIAEVGEEIGIWEMTQDGPGGLLQIDESRQGSDVDLVLLNPTQALTETRAAELTASEVNQENHVAIGLGTLGSQIFANLARTGYGNWTLVDKDILLPHNVPRHYLNNFYVGFPKAHSMAVFANRLFENQIGHYFVENVIDSNEEELMQSYKDATTILDMSASVSVARHLALDVDSDARRVSLFLSPNGGDLVLLAEPLDRSVRLDQLEAEYYWALHKDDDLSNHLQIDGERLRYGQSCRDVSSTLPQDLAALHAATGAHAYRSLTTSATARLWRAEEGMTLTSHGIDALNHYEFSVDDWKLSVSQRVLESMREHRSSEIPNETGGVLIGGFDTQRRRVYVAGILSSPPDSEEWPMAYVRGAEGLESSLNLIETQTAGQLGYVGEWHSHPGADTTVSEDDKALFSWLAEHRKKDGLPAVMAIQGSDLRSRWFVSSVDQSYELAEALT